MPIEMELSTHVAEGEGTDTYVEIDCRANVPGISSWSIDFTGDGVYDVVDMTDNPNSVQSQVHKWDRKYSSLGLVGPRVRIITTDGNFFSVSDTIIIHEKINQASNKMIDNPQSLSIIRMPDESRRIYVLRQSGNNDLIEVYEVGRNETYISDKLYTINLTALGILNPVKVRALDNDHIFVASNVDWFGYIHELKADGFGQFELADSVTVYDEINDFTLDKNRVYASLINRNSFVHITLQDNMLVKDSLESFTPEVPYSDVIMEQSGIEVDDFGLLIADYLNQRILRLSGTYKVLEYFGSFGSGEKEFLKPSIVKSHENRIFVFDESRADIQVFDINYNPVCTLEYSIDPGYHNYVEPNFFNDIADFEVTAKVENNMLYYYALILSRSSEKLAMLRLPQWDELRARVRNNKIVFLKDGEIFMAKPDASDLQKILSSDSLPRIEGTLDYPALAPDGRKLVFTSRTDLYNGEPEGGEGNQYAYDNIYIFDIETRELSRMYLGDINGYEIERPVFNSNGDKLIFSAKPTGGIWQIYIYDFEPGNIEKLFDSDENTRFPYFSPDDRFVVFTTDYDGDEEIEIIDTQNKSIRVSVSSNRARDSFPVWSVVYPFEIDNPDLKVESKIAFVSERDFHKGVYYVYLTRNSDSDIRVFDIVTRGEVGDDPDTAALEITHPGLEGDYPCFTGDGRALIFECYDGQKDQPVIEYILAEDSGSITLNAESSKGKKIDMSSAVWTISGEGRTPIQMTGSQLIADLTGFRHKINVNLMIR